jgi:asparagine synthase (glutamine-hydrolysing)
MCGFAGIVTWDNRHRVHRDVLEKMSARVAHRGPDGAGLWINHEGEATAERPQVGLVHRRLAIIDLDERANQPFTDGRGRWLVFNGEIYNYRELRKELESLLPDYAWRTQSDTEVLLASYAAWGEKCVEHLNGMFAFAIWEEPKGELFLARDRMGQKPLYVLIEREGDGNSATVRSVAFASELEAVREVSWYRPAASEPLILALYEYLSWGYNLGTPFSAPMLNPGETLRVRRDDKRSVSYFPHMLRGPADKDREKLGDDERVAATREGVERAVRRQLVADVPVGCFLSGGVDSSVIAACMKRAAGDQRVLTFSIGFDDPRYDETKYAADVAKHLGTEHHAFTVRPNAVDDLPKLAEVFGDPFADSSALPTHYLARETRKHVKVALSGDGGDELFGGYDRYRAIALTERVRALPAPVRAVIAGRLARRMARWLPGVHPKSTGARLKRFASSLDLEPNAQYASFLRLFDQETIDALLQLPSQQADLRVRKNLQQGRFWTYERTRGPVVAALAADRETYLPGDLLTKVDRCSMLHALEVRSPFMDHDLVRFASTLTTPQLLKGGPKRMLREAFANDLPAWVFKRKKMGFAVPIGDWFRTSLRAMLHDHLFAADSFAAGHFNQAVVRRLVEEHETQRVDHSQRLYALLMLELWWKTQAQ